MGAGIRQTWLVLLIGMAVVGLVLAAGKAMPVPGIDSAAFEDIKSCALGHGIDFFTHLLICPWWPDTRDALFLSLTPGLMPAVILVFVVLRLRRRRTRT